MPKLNFLRVAWRDISSIFKDNFLKVSVIAIIIVPLMYSFFYLYAFWDPYSKLDKLPVAVVNLDKGAYTDNKMNNYGKDIIDKLKHNTQVGWHAVSLDNAEKGLKGDKYYAMFIIPDDFSKNVVSAKNGSPVKPTLKYISNDKKNFLAAQIDNKVMLELKDEISENITHDYVKVAFDNLNDLKDGLNQAKDGSSKLSDGMEKISKGSADLSYNMNKLYQSSINIANGTDDLLKGSNTLTSGLNQTRKSVYQIQSQLENSGLNNLLTSGNLSTSIVLLNDARDLSDTDTTIFTKLSPFMQSNTIQSVNKFINDYNKTDLSTLTNSSLVKSLPALATPENITNIQSALNDATDLSNTDIKSVSIITNILDNSDKINALLNDTQKLSGIDTNKLSQFITNQNNSMNNFISTANTLNTEQNNQMLKTAIDTNPNLSDTQKTQLKTLIDGYYNLISSTESNMSASSANLTEISNNIDNLNALESELNKNLNLLNTLQSSLSYENTEYLKQTFAKLTDMQNDLKKNQQNILAAKNLLANMNNPSFYETIKNLNTLNNDIENLTPLINTLGQMNPKDVSSLNNAPLLINKLNKMKNDLAENRNTLNSINGILSKYPKNISMLLNNLSIMTNGADMLYNGSLKLNNGIKQLNDNMPQFVEGSKKLYTGTTELNNGIVNLNSGANELRNKLTEGSNKLNENLKNSSNVMASFISKPLKVLEDPINLVKNYGIGFTPYFIPLSLWVGTIMMFFIITDKVDDDMEISAPSIVIGKFLSYGYIGIMQAVLASIIVLFLGLKPNNIYLFFLFNIFMSFVFIAIIQSLVFLLGQAGRLLSIILLILQLTSCAGTFPLELVPGFFKVINPFMPFTYCDQALREIISGVDYAVLRHDSIILLAMFLVFLLISIMMKERADIIKNKIREKSEAVESIL